MQAEPSAVSRGGLQSSPPSGGAGAIGRAALLAGGLVAAGFLLHAVGPGLLSGLRPTAAGAALMLAGGGMLSAAGVPRSVTAFAGGYAFGLWAGLALAMGAQLLGCLVTFLWARLIGRGWSQGWGQDWAQRRLAGRWAALHGRLIRRPFAATLTLRLLPVGSNLLVNLAAGLAGIPAAPFMAATVIGYLPQTVIFCLLGSGVHVGRGLQLGLAAALFAASATLGLLLARPPKTSPPTTET
jgi:uncharacterized membrane protein YdjX (TVP38/TMEM64 family)